MRRRFRRVVLAVTALAIVAIAGGVTYAVAEIGRGGVINGCYKSVNGQLRVIDPATDRTAGTSWIERPNPGKPLHGDADRQGCDPHLREPERDRDFH